MISVVIPTYNRARLLRLSLSALARQTAPKHAYRVIVVDDGSTDDTREVVASFESELRIDYVHQEHVGFRVGRARNLGAALVKSGTLAFIDSGVVVGSGFIEAQLELRREGRGGASAVAVIGYVYAFNNYKSFDDLPLVVDLSDPDSAQPRLRSDAHYHDVRESVYAPVADDLRRLPAPWSVFWSTNISVPAEAFQRVGGFDEDFCNWGMEDVDLGYRLFRSGTPIELSREIWAIHTPHERDNAANFQANDLNKRLFLRKHPGPFSELYQLSTGLQLNQHCERLLESLRALRRSEAQIEHPPRELVEAARGGARVLVMGPCTSRWAETLTSVTFLEHDAREHERRRHLPNVRHALGLRLEDPTAAYSAALLIGVSRTLSADLSAEVRKEAARVAERCVEIDLPVRHVAPSVRA